MYDQSSAAEFSPCRAYRYLLWRRWADPQDYLMVVGLNPSTADETLDDPTIRKCRHFATEWGHGALCMVNLFAVRATDPKDMLRHPQPVGDENNQWLSHAATGAGRILLAWGKHGSHLHRDETVRSLLLGFPLYCIKRNGDGSPIHPLYQLNDSLPVGF